MNEWALRSVSTLSVAGGPASCLAPLLLDVGLLTLLWACTGGDHIALTPDFRQ